MTTVYTYRAKPRQNGALHILEDAFKKKQLACDRSPHGPKEWAPSLLFLTASLTSVHHIISPNLHLRHSPSLSSPTSILPLPARHLPAPLPASPQTLLLIHLVGTSHWPSTTLWPGYQPTTLCPPLPPVLHPLALSLG